MAAASIASTTAWAGDAVTSEVGLTTEGMSAACVSVTESIEGFRRAMVDADAASLTRLADPNLSFGHSNGVVQTREEFVDSVALGQEIFLKLELRERTCRSNVDVVMERHLFDAEILIMGEPLNVVLNVLEVWHNVNGAWRLVARQAFAT